MKELDAIVIGWGDQSVGIPHPTWTIYNVGTLDDYPTQREDFRKQLKEAFDNIAEGVVVYFSDERNY